MTVYHSAFTCRTSHDSAVRMTCQRLGVYALACNITVVNNVGGSSKLRCRFDPVTRPHVKVTFLCSAASSTWVCSKHFTLHPLTYLFNSTSVGSIQSHCNYCANTIRSHIHLSLQAGAHLPKLRNDSNRI